MIFPKRKTKFIRPDGSVGRSPGHGVVLLGVGEVANDALRNSGLSFVVDVKGRSLDAPLPQTASDDH
jgi:hypothetical protein